MFAGSLLFVLGFSAVFVILGAVAGSFGNWLIVNERLLTVILGIVTIVLGIAFLGFVPWLQRDVRVHKVPAVGLAAAPVLGFLFGLGWTPCVGPTLGVISTLAFNEGRRAGAPCCSAATHSASGCRSSSPASPGDGRWAPSRSSVVTRNGSPAPAAQC